MTCANCRRPIAIPLILAVSCTLPWTRSAWAREQHPYTGTVVLDFEHHGEPPMRLPTSVAVSQAGHAFVSDGVNDRILEFDPTGKLIGEIRTVADRALSRPMGIKIDARGNLWIADTGSAHVLVRAPDGTLAREITVQGEGPQPPDITDVVTTGDGKTVWLVDNDHHSLIRFEGDSTQPTRFGTKGESLGQLHYPYMVAAGKGDELFVTDVINARVQVVTATGAFSRALGARGLDLGQFYRPKGIACDNRGNVWVADSALGVVQVFTAAGASIDVLRDPEGKPFRFQQPCGIAFDAEGHLYVVELQRARVRKLKVNSPPQTGATAKARPQDTGPGMQARVCTVCHITWMFPFSEGRGTELMDLPVDPRDNPLVSHAETCLSCHDGSVVDSRRPVWQEHTHTAGLEPPESMTVPAYLPLVDGRLACRTCHTAHGGKQPETKLSGAVFMLRVDNTDGALCVSCHTDKAGEAGSKSHLTGRLPVPVADRQALSCQECHSAHGRRQDRLLVHRDSINESCLNCHQQTHPDVFRDGKHGQHPLSPKASVKQVAAVAKLGTMLGPDNRLNCLSCHKLHDAKSPRFLLAEDAAGARLCLRCHDEQNAVAGTAHDLGGRVPDETHPSELAAATAGVCGSCHQLGAHPTVPSDQPTDLDGGQCLNCHRTGGLAQAKTLGPISHPEVKCRVCHDPHGSEEPSFLRQPIEDLCIECHDLAEDLAGPHTFEDRPDVVNPRGGKVEDVGPCLICHSVHHGLAKPLWGASTTAPTTVRDKCAACHKAGGFAQAKAIQKLNHPNDCTTCHNPHADADEYPALLIEDPPAQNLCLTCHEDHQTLEGGPHDVMVNPSVWPKPSQEKQDRCLACHRPHGNDETTLFRVAAGKQVQGFPVAERQCRACHRNGGPVTPPAIARHPQVPMWNLSAPGQLGFLPLFNDQGEIDRRGTLSCRTCHLTHGRAEPAPAGDADDAVGASEMRARKNYLRDFGAASVCILCHGSDGLRRFLYFHDPDRRRGPIGGQAGAASPARRPPADPAPASPPQSGKQGDSKTPSSATVTDDEQP
ncbi:MAG: cytochrome c3 family protein [Phycisphaerae bacterium]